MANSIKVSFALALALCCFVALLKPAACAGPSTSASARIPDDEVRANPPPPVVDSMPAPPKSAEKNLTVLLLPHSHDDTGWQRTVDQYYLEEVQYIYSSVVAALKSHAHRKFVFVETAFFMRWWREQDSPTRDTVRTLFKNGQLEFINGGWCMADDASPGWDAFIDQVTLGHRYIADTLGEEYVPKYAWHIDPFGLSASYSSLFASMNFSAWVFNRVDTRLKDLWHNETRLQFQWEFETSGAGVPGVFGHVLDTHYGAPSLQYKGQNYHFDWEVFGGLGGGENPGSQWPVPSTLDPVNEPFYKGPSLDDIAEAFVALARLRAGFYRLGPPYQKVSPGTGVILIPFGDDMKFQNARKQYSNMDRLMARVNERFNEFNVHVKYATLGDYFDLIDRDQQLDDWPTFDQDFMPLGTNPNIYTSQVNWNPNANKDTDTSYWTGHYTTRPLMKSLVARAGHEKHTAEIASTLFCAANAAQSSSNADANALCGQRAKNDDILLPRAVTSVVQHHDSITGTSKPGVTQDLDVRLVASIDASERVLRLTMNHNSNGPLNDSVPISMRGQTVHSKVTDVTPGSSTDVKLFNGMVHARINEPIEVELEEEPVAASDVLVVDATDGSVVPSVVVPPVPTPFAFEGNGYSNSPANSTAWTLVFLAPLIPPLSSRTYHIKFGATTTATNSHSNYKWECGADAAASLSSDAVKVSFDPSTRRLSSITQNGKSNSDKIARKPHTQASFSINVEQEFYEWHSTSGSSAYQFLPNRTAFPFGEAFTVIPTLCMFQGNGVVSRSAQTYGAPYHLREVVSLYYGGSKNKDTNALVETWTEFSMSRPDREMVTRYMTNINNTEAGHYFNSTQPVDYLPHFETDSNGYLMMQRVTNKTAWVDTNHEDYFHVARPVAGNFYPLSGAPGAIRMSGYLQNTNTNENDNDNENTTGSFAILTDTAHGAAALKSGWMEVMLGRRVDEASGISVNDTDLVTAKNWLIVGSNPSAVAEQHRLLAASVSTPLVPILSAAKASGKSDRRAAGADIAKQEQVQVLPDAVHLLSLDRLGVETTVVGSADRVLLRVANIHQRGEGPQAKILSFTLSDLLAPVQLSVQNIVEVPLNGVGMSAASGTSRYNKNSHLLSDFVVELTPLQIRTFEVTLMVKQK